MDFRRTEDFLAHFKGLLDSRYRSTGGAMFSAVLALIDQKWILAAGRAVFLDDVAEARIPLKYAAIHLLEEWVPSQEAAYDRLAQLMSGGGAIAGEAIPSSGYRYTCDEGHSSWHPKLTGWTEASFKSDAVDTSNGNRLSLTRDPVTSFGLPPYESGSHVVHEWMHRQTSRQRHSGDPSDLGAFRTILPDTRARIVSAEWSRGQLEVHLEVNVPRNQLELQCLFFESVLARDVLLAAPANHVQIMVPEDAQGASMYLLHSSGVHLGQAAVSRVQRTFDESSRATPAEEQGVLDIQGGENDEVEFKPFLKPGDDKMSEVLETVVAFANTRGGRLYLGINDHRIVEGRTALCRALGAKDEDARAALERGINKLISDKVKPVPKFTPKFIDIHGEPVLVIIVPRGDQRPYATFNNQIYIRKGSTNANPDPTTELPHLFSSSGQGIALPGALGLYE